MIKAIATNMDNYSEKKILKLIMGHVDIDDNDNDSNKNSISEVLLLSGGISYSGIEGQGWMELNE
jgi:hypothetical protein